jgi:flavodoxin I
MKIEVVYHSLTGNTKKVAERIASVFDVEAKNIKKDFVLSDFDILFLGSGVYAGKMSKRLMHFAENMKNLKDKKIALFATYGGDKEAIHAMKTNLESKDLKIIGIWGCRGRFLFAGRGKPDKEDLRSVEEFAKNLLKHKH